MNARQVDELVATVPATVDTARRRRLRAYEQTVRRCEARIQALREELQRAFEPVEETTGTADAVLAAGPDRALAAACELDMLERVQPRVDAWLTEYVAALVPQPTLEAYGDGTPA
jgi:hypothetical protein